MKAHSNLARRRKLLIALQADDSDAGCCCYDSSDAASLAMLSKMIMSGCMGACVGAGGVIVGSLMQIKRFPPREQIAGAAAMMGTIFGFGSAVRGR